MLRIHYRAGRNRRGLVPSANFGVGISVVRQLDRKKECVFRQNDSRS